MPKIKHTARKTTGCHRSHVELAERSCGRPPAISRKTIPFSSQPTPTASQRSCGDGRRRAISRKTIPFSSQLTPSASQQAPANDSEATSMHATAPCFEPLLDFLSTSDSYVMQADVPGVAKPDLCVKLCQEQRVLMMAGKRVSSLTKTINLIQHNHDSHPDYRGNSRTHRHRPGASAAAGTSYILQQRLQGTFEHQLPLPDDADSGAIRAMLEDGVLTIIIRKINKNQNCPQQAWQDIAIT